jgi:hypothetical protein
MTPDPTNNRYSCGSPSITPCSGTYTATPVSKSYDYFFKTGDTSFIYDLSSFFACTGYSGAYTHTALISPTNTNILDTPTTKTVSWGGTLPAFTVPGIYTVAVTATLDPPNTKTVTQLMTLTVSDACLSATLVYSPPTSASSALNYNLGVPTAIT